LAISGGVVFVLVLCVAFIAVGIAWSELGALARGERRERMEQSPQWGGSRFVNPQPLVNHFGEALWSMFAASDVSAPSGKVATQSVSANMFLTPPASGLRVTWLGHSTTLVEVDGVRVLIDPVWSDRPTPLPGVGPSRWYPPLIDIPHLPPIDAVLISHDHYDHLDAPTVRALAARGTTFIVPLGVGAHLEYWQVAPERIIELDWWDSTRVGTTTIVSTPARHASGRMLVDNDATLWSGFAIIGDVHRVYYSGDTGLLPAMRDIGARYGPFDCTLIEVGQYHRAWPDWHIGPEQAVLAHEWVRGKVMLPVHWGLFRLAYHGWTEPVERVLAEAQVRGVVVATPRPGESVEPTLPLVTSRWWPHLPWETATQHPIRSTQIPEPDSVRAIAPLKPIL
jgi:L-ascorbate metabolism protein UlaG (beta-lactamase superfamily)